MIREIEPRENEFITHFRMMLRDTFPLALGHEAKYVIGEDEQGRRGLYFELTSKKFGKLYSKFGPITTMVDEQEDEFIHIVINDLVIAGITFMNVEAYEKIKNKAVEEEIQHKGFKNHVPLKALFVN